MLIFQRIFSIQKYQAKHKELWDNFTSTAKNATFLFYRDFMEYHSDRFHDFSLLIFKKKELVAILPANRDNDCVYSHLGLSYGGLVLPDNISFNEVLYANKELLRFLSLEGFTHLKIKLLPEIYHTLPSDEIQYLLFKIYTLR